MRPLKLKMSAFGAYVKPIELDFETGLNGANFFLIHGATGSGKTTILDAICYALYGESSGGGRTGKMMRSEQAFPTTKTEVEFTFALRGKTYRIRRNPKYMRARIRGGGLTEENASAEIYEDERRLETKDVSEYVRDLLKFDSEQFRQVVMLPQGAFQKFLLAKSDARQVVLNMLFNADFFKRVEDELKVKAADAKKLFETLTERKNTLLEETGCPEVELPALIQKLTEELQAAQSQLKALEAEALTAQKNYSDADNLAKQFKDLETKSRALTEAQEFFKKLSEDLKAAQIEFDKRQAEEPQRKDLEHKATELAKKKTSLQNLQAKRKELTSAVNAAQTATAKVTECKRFKVRCDETMTKLKRQEETLRDAPAKLEEAKQKLKAAQDREKLTTEVADLRGRLKTLEKDSIAAGQAHAETEKSLAELREAQQTGRAALLATTLEDGKPCPVCGAIHHPSPAKSDSTIPTDAQIKAVETKLKTLADRKTAAERNLAELKGKLATQENTLSETAQVVTVAEAQAAFDKLSADAKALERCQTRIKTGEVKIREADTALDAAIVAEKKALGAANTLRGVVDNMTQEVDAKYLSDDKLLDAEIAATAKQLDALNTAFKRAQDNFNQLNNRVAAQRATVESAQKIKAEVAAQVEGKTSPDMLALKKILDSAQATWKASVEAKANSMTRLDRLKDTAKKISALNVELTAADKNFLMWKTLSDAASGKVSKISFQRYYLATMFKEVIAEANNRLEKMSGGRYRFQNKETVTDRRYSGGLDLEIVDDYSGTARPVETLSGGESFLASLSLALGLAAVVQNNAGGIKLDTIFIDEGFGTLDAETLDFAMKTLIELQSGGRLVGIISHVEELKNQMPVRLEVYKTKVGSSAKFIS